MATANKQDETMANDSELKKELQSLRDDLMSVKKDLGKVGAAAVEQGQERAQAAKNHATDQFEQGISATRQYVQEKPFTSALAAVGVGIVVGMILAKK